MAEQARTDGTSERPATARAVEEERWYGWYTAGIPRAALRPGGLAIAEDAVARGVAYWRTVGGVVMLGRVFPEARPTSRGGA